MELITPPAIEPITLVQLKRQARIPYNDSDEILALYIQSAREIIEKYLNRALITQTWDLRLDWGPAWVELPFGNLQSIAGVFTTGLDNVEITVPPPAYITDLETQFLGLNIGNVWPLHRGKAGWRVRYTCGYGDTADKIPATIRRYILALATTMDNTRDDVGLSDSMQDGLLPYRIVGELPRMARGMSREDVLG